jgi:hypothetical protein
MWCGGLPEELADDATMMVGDAAPNGVCSGVVELHECREQQRVPSRFEEQLARQTEPAGRSE